jgi:hypothetical protein
MFIKDLISIVKISIESFVGKIFRPFCQKYSILGWGLATIFAYLYIPIVYEDLKSGASKLDSSYEMEAALPSVPQVAGSINAQASVGGSEYVEFTGFWKPDDPEAYLQNGSEIYLLEGESSVRFDHSLQVPFGQKFKYVFALGGKTGGNLQIGRFDLYEITLGDGDFRTIGVRDSKGELVPGSSGFNRTKLNKEILQDISNELIIEEEILSEREFKLSVDLNQEETLFYIISLPVKWKEKDDMYFALLDLSEGANETSVYWSEPEIGKFINN